MPTCLQRAMMKAVGCVWLFILHFPFIGRKEKGKCQRKFSSDTQGRFLIGQRERMPRGGFQESRISWSPSQVTSCLQNAPTILPSKWLAFTEYLLCAKDGASTSASPDFTPQPLYLSWKPGSVASLRKTGLAKWGEGWCCQACGLGLVNFPLLRAWW